MTGKMTHEKLRKLEDICRKLLDVREKPIKAYGNQITSDIAASRSGMLPIFLMEVNKQWNELVPSSTFVSVIENGNTPTGYRVVKVPEAPSAFIALMLDYIIEQTEQRSHMSMDHLLADWSVKQEHEPVFHHNDVNLPG